MLKLDLFEAVPSDLQSASEGRRTTPASLQPLDHDLAYFSCAGLALPHHEALPLIRRLTTFYLNTSVAELEAFNAALARIESAQ